MALKALVESLDSVPEDKRSLYVEHETEDGEKLYRLDVEPADGWELTNPTGLKRALEKERGRARAAKVGRASEDDESEAEALREEIANLRVQLKDARKPKPKETEGKGEEWENLKAQLLEQHEKALEKVKADNKSLEDELREVLIEGKAREALREGGFKEAEHLMLPVVTKHLRLVPDEKSGRRALEVFDPQHGHPRIGGKNGEPMTPKELVAELKSAPEYSRFADGAGTSGGGLNGQAGGRPSQSTRDYEGLSPEAKLSLAFEQESAGA